MRITIPSGIAAALIVAAFIAWSLHSPAQASAAERLEAAVRATKAYEGWVKRETIHPEKKADPSLPTRDIYYFKSDGSYAWVMERDGKLYVHLCSVPSAEIMSYDGAAGEIHLNTLLDVQKQQGIEDVEAPTENLADLITSEKQLLGHDPVKIKESRDGDVSRFDVTRFSSDEEAKQVETREKVQLLPRSYTMWVNKDHLIVRARFDDRSGSSVDEYTYGITDVESVYDLGDPKSAKVLDERLASDFRTLMNRIDARAAKGFGDYTALLTSDEFDANGQPSSNRGLICLYAVHGNQWLVNRYRLFHATYGEAQLPGVVLQTPPPKWPIPDLQKLVPILREAAPMEYAVMDGDRGWYGTFQAKTLNYRRETVPGSYARSYFPYRSVTAQLWPSSSISGIGSPQRRSDLLHDKAHPSLIGVRYVDLDKSADPVDGGTTWWLDPSQDDMPVQRSSSSKDKSIAITTETHYVDYAQLPNGQWYPTHWRESRTYVKSAINVDSHHTTEYHLQILPTFQLDRSWFQAPEPKTFTSISVPTSAP